MIRKSVLLILPSQNFNEEEYLIVLNALERAGIKVFIASDAHLLCVGSNGLKVKNDIQFYNIHESNFGGVIFIGGSGTRNYWNNVQLQATAQKFSKSRKPVGAICSAPVLLAKAGIISECATCYPDDKLELERQGIQYKNEPVVTKKNIITAQDPSSAPEFVKSFLYELEKSN